MPPGDKASRTLPPTAKKKKDSRKEGKIAKSQDLAGWVALFASTLMLGPILHYMETNILGVMGQSVSVMGHPDQGAALADLDNGLRVFIEAALIIGAVFMAIALFVNVSQVGFVFATKAARPKLSRLSPKEGIKRIFSSSGLWLGVKTFGKIVVIAFVAYKTIDSVAHTVIGSQPASLAPLLAYMGQTIIGIIRDIALLGLVFSIADYAVQRRRVNQSLRMTRQEFRDEMRQTEGDPGIRRRIRRQQIRLSRMRIMAAVAKADVVITNPTHVAVALKYDRATFMAPQVVAKGEGEMARAIKEEAFRVGVPVVEDPPLARAINKACEIDDIIPRELYMAVAHLLAFVYSLSSDARLLGVAFSRPSSSLLTND